MAAGGESLDRSDTETVKSVRYGIRYAIDKKYAIGE
jgi:hypothetical protein